jgi:hypothetical protein
MFAGHGRMVHALRGLVAHPADDRNARVAEDHQRVMQVAHYARELEFQNGIETTDDVLGIDLVVVTEHRVLLGCKFSIQGTPSGEPITASQLARSEESWPDGGGLRAEVHSIT